MKLLNITTGTLAAVALALTSPAFAQEKGKGKDGDKVTAHDEAWAEIAAVNDQCEITLAKAAQEKATSEQLKQHAAKMIEDHSKTTTELKAWAKAKNVDLDVKLPEPKQKMIKEITSKSGAEFDKAYLEHEIAGHRMAAAHFRNGSEFNKDPDLKAWAQKTLPVIEGHLGMVDKGGHAGHGSGGGAAGGAAGAGAGATGGGARTTSPAGGAGGSSTQ